LFFVKKGENVCSKKVNIVNFKNEGVMDSSTFPISLMLRKVELEGRSRNALAIIRSEFQNTD
jgi:hypothetical protein